MIIKICSLNCNGLATESRRKVIFQRIKQLNIDIIFLQEIYVNSLSKCFGLAKELNGKGFFSLGNGVSNGVAIIFRNSFQDNIKNFWHDNEGRIVKVNALLGKELFCLVSVYVPTNKSDRSKFLKDLPLHLVNSKNLILGGDFNFVENISLDKTGSSNCGDHGANIFKDLKSNFEIEDIYRLKYPNGRAFSYSNNRMVSRLDRFYLSKRILKFAKNINYVPSSISDHGYVDLEFELPNSPSIGPGYWKLNVSILDDPDVVSKIESAWLSDLVPLPLHDGAWWDHCKSVFKTILMDESKRLANEKRMKIKELESKLNYYSTLESIAMVPGTFTDIIKNIKAELNNYIHIQLEGNKIRAKAVFLENSEKSTSYFLRREKERSSKKSMEKLEVDGRTIDDVSEIVEACRDFYIDLFSAEGINSALLDDFLGGLPKLQSVDTEKCEGLISYDECKEAISQMANLKTPGGDGLPKEFYQKFFYLIGNAFVEMVNFCFMFDSLTDSQRESLITLLCKNMDKKTLLSFWRPISLLNCDYKIIAKVLANRLKVVMPKIVEKDQTCAIVGRSIHDNCHLLRNVIDYVESRNLACALISLDQMKAFDRVSHQYLFSTLEAFGFGESFIKWLKILYRNSTSAVLVNGHVSDPFAITRGVRQGCPLSPLIYVLCIEPFAIKIRSNPYISGLRLPGFNTEVRITMYADDNTPIVTTPESIREVFLVSERYGLASGSRLNLNKCNGVLLGSAKRWKLPSDYCGINWVPFCKILGFHFGDCNLKVENWGRICPKIEAAADIYKSRSVSLKGQAVIANTVLLSKLWYIGKAMLLPTDF